MIPIQALKKAASRGTVLGVVIAAHLALALLVLLPAAPRPIAPATRPVHRAAVLHITLLRPPPPPPAPPRVPRTHHAPTAAHMHAPSAAPRTATHPVRHQAIASNRARIFRIVGSVLESPRGLLHLPHGTPAAPTLGRALRARIGRLANGRLAIQIPGLPGAPCFALPQHFKNPNNHGLHALLRGIAMVLTPPRLLPYVLAVTSVPDPQPIACHPLKIKPNHVFDLPAGNLFAQPTARELPAARNTKTHAGAPHPTHPADHDP